MVDAATRTMVRQRAGDRCEYCRARQEDFDYFTFHVEHIVPRQHDGTDDPQNLCLACPECNAAKGPNLAGLLRGKLVLLFNPRRQAWTRHFRWVGVVLVGKTRCGRVTIRVLNINGPARVLVRRNLRDEGLFSS
jgi:hypothetical protein